jgi:phage-related minor tail protein
MTEKRISVALDANTAGLERGTAAAASSVEAFSRTSQASFAAAAGASGKMEVAINTQALATRALEEAGRRLAESESQASARYRQIAQDAISAAAARSTDLEATRVAAAAERDLMAAQMASSAASRQTAQAQAQHFQMVTTEVNATSAAIASIGSGATSMQAVQAQTDKLVQLWNSGRISGEQYDAAVKRIDASEASLAAASAKASAAGDKFVATLREQAETAGMSSTQLLEYRAAQLGVSDRAAPLIAQLGGVKKGFDGAGISAKQTAAAMRLVPAQVTDIVTSLEGGQSVMTVLLQQGGQLKDSFGGIIPALQGVGSYVRGLVGPITLAGAAIVAVSIAASQGAGETTEYAKALAMSGNYAGVTSGQMSEMAANIGRIKGTQGGASEALISLAKTGQIAGSQMEGIGLAAVKAKDAWGKSVDETAKDFERLGEAPAATLLKLNENYNFLTASVYAQVAALEDQGKKQEAARLAQDTYSAALGKQADDVKAQAGTLSRAWDGLASSAKGAWDAMLNVGRPKSLADMKAEFGAVQGQIADLQKNRGFAETDSGAVYGGGNNQGAQALKRMQASSAAMGSAIEDEEKKRADARGKGLALAQEQQKISNTKQLNELSNSVRSREQIRDDELAKTKLLIANSTYTEEQGQALLAGIRKKYEDKPAAAGASAHEQQMAGIQSQIDAEKQLAASLELEGVASAKVNSGDKLAIQIQNQLGLAVSQRANKQTDAQLKQALSKAQELAALQKENDLREKAKKLAADTQGWEDKLTQQTTALSDSLQEQTDLFGKSGQARTIAAAQSKILRDAEKLLSDEQKKGISVTDEKAQQIREYAKASADLTGTLMGQIQAEQGAQQLLDENKKFSADSILDERGRAKALLEIDADTWRERIRLAGDGTAAQQQLSEQFNTWYANQKSKPGIDAAKKTLTDIDNIFQQSFVDMTNGGKGTWETFTKSLGTTFKTMVANEVYKAFLKPIVVNVVGQLTGIMGLDAQGGSSGGILSALGGLLGGSGGGMSGGMSGGNNNPGAAVSGLSNISTITNLFGMLKSGFGTVTDYIGGLFAKMGGDAVAGSAFDIGAAAAAAGADAAAAAAAAAAGGTAAAGAAAGAASAAAAAGMGAASTALAAGASTGVAAAAAASGASAAAAAAAGSAAAAAAANAAAGGLGAQLAAKMVASWPVALAYAVWQNDKMYKDGVRYKDMDVTGVGSLVNAPMKFVDDTLQKIGLSGRIANLFSGLALSAMVWGKNGMFGGETRYGSGPYVGYSTGDVVQGEGGPSGGDPNLDGTKALVQNTYDTTKDLIKSLGGTADALYMFNDWELSPKKGNSFVRSVVRNDAGDGGPDFDNRIDLDTKDYADVMTAYATEMKRSMLAAVANSNVDQSYKDYIANNADLKTADDATLDSLMTGIQKIQAFSVALKEMPFANMRDLTLSAGMALANFMGGLDSFQTTMDGYFNSYYSDTEKFNKQTTDMTREFANIGYALPASKAAFRSMAESLDLSTKSGRDTYVALMNLNQGFSEYEDTVTSVANSLVQQAQEAQQAQDAQRQTMTSAIQEAYDRESSALTNVISGLESFIGTIDKFRKSLLLGGSTTLSLAGQYDEAKRQYQDTLARANAGDTDAQADLQGAAQAFLDASKNRYASSDSYLRDFDMVQANLAAAQASAEGQLDVAKRQLSLMQQQVDGILDINKNLVSLASALAAYASAFGKGNSYLAANPDVAAAYASGAGGSLTPDQYAAYHYAAYGASEGRGPAGVQMSEADKYLMQNPDVLAAYQAGNGGGMTPEQYAAFHYQTYGQNEGRAFAKGGLAGEGWNLVGERGPELVNFSSPGRVYTASDTRQMMAPDWSQMGRGDGAMDALVGELKALRAEVAQLRQENRQDAKDSDSLHMQATDQIIGATISSSSKTTRAFTNANQKRRFATV